MLENDAKDALRRLLNELPMEFSMYEPGEGYTRDSFSVIKRRNVLTVHQALWDLQQYFGVDNNGY
jgi:hypothetical protein